VFAGVDAGGSRCEAVIIDPQGQVLARARGGPAALRPDNAREVAGQIGVTLGRALSQVAPTDLIAVVVAAAGAGRMAERQALAAALAEGHIARRVEIKGDGEAALESAFGQGPGMILISGTGSIAYARDASGTVHRTGGLGWQLGDEGSGYAIGRAALQAAGRAADHRGGGPPYCSSARTLRPDARISINWFSGLRPPVAPTSPPWRRPPVTPHSGAMASHGR
jgi:N-acetylglucosamine kinase-like BadF-type ATPase